MTTGGGPELIIIKKKAKGHGAHGAAWKVAYADFVTAMMALFMVLWLVSQTDQKIKKAISEYFRTGVFAGAPSVLEGGLGVSEHGFVDTKASPSVVDAMESGDAGAKFLRDAVRRAVGRTGARALSDRITITATKEGTLLQIAEGRDELLFDLSSAELKPPLVKLLAALAPELARLGQPIELHGHTDARPFASAAGRNNWTLSFDRAEMARVLLERSGFPPQLMAGVFAHASTEPVDPDPFSPVNRRLSIFARNSRLGAPSPPAPPPPAAAPSKPEPAPVERGPASKPNDPARPSPRH